MDANVTVLKNNREIINWDFSDMGLFEVTIWDGKITGICFCRRGSDIEGERLIASAGCEDFLKCVHKALGEILDYTRTK